MPIDWNQLSDVDPKYLPKNPNAPPPTTIITKYGPMVIRGAGGLLAGEGGPTGAFISGASELAAQKLAGERNPASVAGAAAIGAIPFGSTANIARAALKGGALSGGATALNQQTEAGLHAPSKEELQQIALATGIGGATAGGLHALGGGAGKKIPLKNEPKLLPAGRERLQLRDFNPTETPVVGGGPFPSGPGPEVKLAGSGQTPAAKAASPVKSKAKIVTEKTVPIGKDTTPIVKTPKQLEDEAMLRAELVRIQRENKTTPSTKNSKIPKAGALKAKTEIDKAIIDTVKKAKAAEEGVDPTISKLVGGKGKKNAPRKGTGKPIISADDPRLAANEGLANAFKIKKTSAGRYTVNDNYLVERTPDGWRWHDDSGHHGGEWRSSRQDAMDDLKDYLANQPKANEGLQEPTVPIGNSQEAMFHSEQPTVELPGPQSEANDFPGTIPNVEPPVNVNSGSMPNVASPTANEPPITKINVPNARSYQPPRLPRPAEVGMRVEDLGGTRQGGGFIPPPSQPPPPGAGGFFNRIKREIPRDPKTGRVDFSEMINFSKAFKASGDLSASLRQGITLMRRKAWRDSIVPMIRSLKNSNYKEELSRIENHPMFKEAQKNGVRFSAVGESGKAGEEAFGSKLARKVPILGKQVVARSEQAYTTFLNSLRIKTYEEMVNNARRMQAKDPKGFGEIPYQNIANYINTASGRGSLAPTITSSSKTGERAAEVLNLGLFSPRFIASRMQLMNPYTYYKLDPFTRKEALKDMGSMIGMVGSALTLAKASGAEVTLDPRESDWGKIKSGNTRVDLTGGFGPYMRFFAQAMNGVATGEEGPDLARFVKSKESPTVGIASEVISGKDFFGKEQARWKPIAKTILPMIGEDWYDLLQSDPDILTGGGAGAAALFGLPVQSYDSTTGRKSGSSKGSSAKSSRTRYKP